MTSFFEQSEQFEQTPAKRPVPSSPVTSVDSILAQLPSPAKAWVESLSWQQRRYVLSLCHLMCAAPPEVQAEFLDEYTADGLVSKKLEDQETRQRVGQYLKEFQIETDLTEAGLRAYIRQFYLHSAQDMRRQPDLYLQSALRLVFSTEERNNVFNYILGVELLKMMFCMSWFQHEKLYRLQRNQDEFINQYIKPIQYAHRINGIIVPKDEDRFFARRDYFVQKPKLSRTKLTALVMATFTTEVASNFGFTIIRHPNSLCFDYDYIFQDNELEITGLQP
ncbi:cobyrinic acid a,c-diamide synthase [Leptolyngbya sp. NK1-12]|uniref:cobyrinic acid a,c-diamide synthase n=1 Tax=Leptolyngbya sp. NK1-12 TaxID=2547451 RepID=UPI0029310DAD|nr:cobyrinic acid a,c-diamide synthase [Leptolyngbya sp. NK1-12]